jgi:hypothetical protein
MSINQRVEEALGNGLQAVVANHKAVLPPATMAIEFEVYTQAQMEEDKNILNVFLLSIGGRKMWYGSLSKVLEVIQENVKSVDLTGENGE